MSGPATTTEVGSFAFSCDVFAPVALESSSHVARRSSSRASVTSLSLLLSVDVLGLPGACFTKVQITYLQEAKVIDSLPSVSQRNYCKFVSEVENNRFEAVIVLVHSVSLYKCTICKLQIYKICIKF